MNSLQANRGILRRNCLCFGACAGALLLVPLGFLLFVLLFYVEEDWRGARAWVRAKADIAAQGESIDAAKFTPPPVPDVENFGALPHFKIVGVHSEYKDVELKRFAISETLKPFADNITNSPDDSSANAKLPFLGNWQKGQPPDSGNFAARMVAFIKLHKSGAGIEFNATPFQIFERACPAIAELRAAEKAHPKCLFPEPINYQVPWKQSFGTDTSLLTLEKVLCYDAQLAMLDNQSDIPLEDFRVGWKIASGEQKRPFYVSNLVAAGIMAMQLRIIQQGLATHAWTGAQVAALESDLGKIDYLTQSRWQINGEIACYNLPMIDFYTTHRGKWSQDINVVGTMFGKEDSLRESAYQATYLLLPNGWFKLAKADEAQRKIKELRRIDLAAYQVDPGKEPERSSDPALRWIDFIIPDTGLMKNMEKHIAYAQVQLDEAKIACLLERYHLAHDSFPVTLDALVPTYGAELPHDIITGKPYIYRLDTDGNYTLYSAGWNQKDDGGDMSSPGMPSSFYSNSESNDWVWLNHVIKKK